MAEAKTKPTTISIEDFFAKSVDPTRHDDCRAIAAMMQKATGEPPVMWGASIVGFGRTLVAYAGGKTAEWMMIGFSPRKTELVLYGLLGSPEAEALLSKIGKHKTGKGCLYIKRVADVDAMVLKKLIEAGVSAAS
jgi:Domain of unknown function (DU1801)